MSKNTNELSLVKKDSDNIFYKIKIFFKKLFYKENVIINNVSNDITETTEYNKKIFLENLKQIESKDINILELQRKYRNKDIKEEDLTEEQINSLCELYDKQIFSMKKEIELKKQKILNYKKSLQ